MKNYEKLDANTLKIVTPVEVQEEVATYEYQDLVGVLDALTAQKDAFNVDIDVQIADAQAAVDAANGFGLVAKEAVLEVRSVQGIN